MPPASLVRQLDLSEVNRVDYNCFRYGHVQSAVLERHVGTAVVRAYAGVGNDNVWQLSVSRVHECLVKCTAEAKQTEGVRIQCGR